MTTAIRSDLATWAQPREARLVSIDQMRALALVLMAVFHFGYDLSVFGYLSFDATAPFWAVFRSIIVTLFFLSVGASLSLANATGIRWGAFWTRELKIVAGALTFSVATWFLYPGNWIWFGVLHFIAVASVLALPLLRTPRLALIAGISILTLFNLTDWFTLAPLYQFLREPLALPDRTMDLTRLIPWLGMVYIGVYLGHQRLFGIRQLPFLPAQGLFIWLSRHSLGFYLIHQIPLYGLAWLIYLVIG
ncbi:heparan-alpha-glucosaminide N-acetyltransferase [Saccharospirillum impatiens]|uniref:heparan-alpha-glucosaminide N-acetyltransferase n=1 Tax=Saccharospirillum impatiens TaxID=169438 RepID=UPI000408F5AE|nr:heparan-alpha-glucosaminide N-acetyltransferase [Saccharospirillum impatiens]